MGAEWEPGRQKESERARERGNSPFPLPPQLNLSLAPSPSPSPSPSPTPSPCPSPSVSPSPSPSLSPSLSPCQSPCLSLSPSLSPSPSPSPSPQGREHRCDRQSRRGPPRGRFIRSESLIWTAGLCSAGQLAVALPSLSCGRPAPTRPAGRLPPGRPAPTRPGCSRRLATAALRVIRAFGNWFRPPRRRSGPAPGPLAAGRAPHGPSTRGWRLRRLGL